MQLSLPSKRRAARFLVAFYAMMAVLFFGFYSVVLLGFFGTPTTWVNMGLFAAEIGVRSAIWPTTMVADETTAALLLVGMVTALVEPRVTEVGN